LKYGAYQSKNFAKRRVETALVLEDREEAIPRLADAVDPVPEACVMPRVVAELVREHGAELLARQARHQRQADDEVVGRKPEQAEPRHLGDRGVEIGGDDHAMDALRADVLPHSLDLVEERGASRRTSGRPSGGRIRTHIAFRIIQADERDQAILISTNFLETRISAATPITSPSAATNAAATNPIPSTASRPTRHR
jgi:hypothetical protein